jgi:hypothetical protein
MHSGPPVAVVIGGVTTKQWCHHGNNKEHTMKKITARKVGTIRLTSAASPCYCGSITQNA